MTSYASADGPRIHRRAFVAGCGVAALGALACRRTPSDASHVSSEELDRPVLPPLPPRGPDEIDLVALGDWGADTPERAAVIARIVETTEGAPPACVALLGDNFYREGIASADDPRWRRDFEDCFPEARLPMPFYAVLGNHDHRGNVQAQVEYTRRSSRWRMPARRYAFELPLGDSDQRAAFFALDTTPAVAGERGDPAQVEWLERELSGSNARWKIVLGHHPILSYGAHGGARRLGAVLEPLFARHGVQLYLSGHDHDLQLVRSPAGWRQIVSGSVSGTRSVSTGPGTEFASATPGFARLRLGVESAVVELVEARRGPTAQFRFTRDELGSARSARAVGGGQQPAGVAR